MLTVLAFIVALGVLIAVHEYGHYRVAVACGVKVLRFSIGFGKTLLRWQPKGSPTEFVIGMFPLGGYVKMLDEREGPVPAEDRHRAFNTQPLHARAAIVAAGPAANLLLAVVLYAAVNWAGVNEPQPLLGRPIAGSLADLAGLRGGERVMGAGFADESPEPVRSFESVRWLLTRGAIDSRDVRLELEDGRALTIPLSRLAPQEADAQMFNRIGVLGPWTTPVLGDIAPDGAAAAAGLQRGDVVQKVGGVAVVDGQHLRELIRASIQGPQAWQIERAGVVQTVNVQPAVQLQQGVQVGRIGAYVGGPPAMVKVRYGPVEGLVAGAVRTWDVSSLTVRMMGRMLIGEASIKNISGPLTIADYAGKSASLGLTQFLAFMALISVSLGVLNLLPLPVLDGGHLMYYLWEGVTGKSVSEPWMERLQRGGIAVLLVMMSIALFNDVTRLLG